MNHVTQLESTDGRNIDEQLGTLSGEASLQKSRDDKPEETNADRHVFHDAPSATAALADPTYYGRPLLKKSVWSWAIPLYYYAGGTAGGVVVLGAAATLAGRRAFPRLIARSRWIGTAGGAVSAALLIYDLGKPARFLNMLRVFRPTSPMNMGSWILTGFSSLAGASAIMPVQAVAGPAAVGAGAFGLLLSGYTGVLVANTAVPIWQRPHRIMPLLFISSAASSAAALLDLFRWNKSEQRAIDIFGTVAKTTDLALSQFAESRIGSVPEAAEPLHKGFGGFLWQTAKILTAASLALSIAPGQSRRKTRWIGLLGTAGALCLRFSIHEMGRRSAENPRATFHQQRAGQGAYEIAGRAAITGPHAERAVS